jgi:uncharacterized RDD family membrane protein YckC
MNRKQLLHCPSASLFKQFIAMLYDGFLIAALLFLATAILLPFNDGEAISGPAYSLYLLMVIFIFYSWFWHKAGQTLGMKAWKIRIIDEYGLNPSWPINFLRLFSAIIAPLLFIVINMSAGIFNDSKINAFITGCFFLLGYLPRLWSTRTWHDRLSQTRIVDISGVLKQEAKPEDE